MSTFAHFAYKFIIGNTGRNNFNNKSISALSDDNDSVTLPLLTIANDPETVSIKLHVHVYIFNIY